MMVLENNIFKLSWAWDLGWASGGPCFIFWIMFLSPVSFLWKRKSWRLEAKYFQ
jgi:hypothetical protein